MSNLLQLNSMTMSSREIASLTGKLHKNVLEVIRSLVQGGVLKSSRPHQYEHEQNGQLYPEFLCDKRDSLVIVARLSPEFTAAVVDRWQELEQALQPRVPKTLAEALRLAADQQDQIEAQQALIEQQKPAVEFVERYVEASGSKGFREVAKLLKANEREFREFLKNERIMYILGGAWVPYEQHLKAGRFEVKTGTSEHGDHAYTSSKFTPKGVNWVSGLWSLHKTKMALH